MGGALEYERGDALEGVINNIQVSVFVCSIFLKTCAFLKSVLKKFYFRNFNAWNKVVYTPLWVDRLSAAKWWHER